jgi:hypothetical protein
MLTSRSWSRAESRQAGRKRVPLSNGGSFISGEGITTVIVNALNAPQISINWIADQLILNNNLVG